MNQTSTPENKGSERTGNGIDNKGGHSTMSGVGGSSAASSTGGGAGSSYGSTGSSSTGSQSGSGSMGSSTGSQSGSSFGAQSLQSGASAKTEGTVARAIEQQTAKLPSDLFLWGAFGAIAVSAIFEFTGNHDKSRFVGQWVAPIMLMGVYNKIVKTQGSDQLSS